MRKSVSGSFVDPDTERSTKVRLDPVALRTEILLSAATKTKRARTMDLTVSPALCDLLTAMRTLGGGQVAVFPGTRLTVEAAAKRPRKVYGAPMVFTWQALRRTCGTFLTNAPGIFGSASAYRSAKQLGPFRRLARSRGRGLDRRR